MIAEPLFRSWVTVYLVVLDVLNIWTVRNPVIWRNPL